MPESNRFSFSPPSRDIRAPVCMYIYVSVCTYICSRQDLRQPHSLVRASLHRHANLQQARAPRAASLCRAKTRSRKVISSLSRHRETDVFLLPIFSSLLPILLSFASQPACHLPPSSPTPGSRCLLSLIQTPCICSFTPIYSPKHIPHRWRQ